MALASSNIPKIPLRASTTTPLRAPVRPAVAPKPAVAAAPVEEEALDETLPDEQLDDAPVDENLGDEEVQAEEVAAAPAPKAAAKPVVKAAAPKAAAAAPKATAPAPKAAAAAPKATVKPVVKPAAAAAKAKPAAAAKPEAEAAAPKAAKTSLVRQTAAPLELPEPGSRIMSDDALELWFQYANRKIAEKYGEGNGLEKGQCTFLMNSMFEFFFGKDNAPAPEAQVESILNNGGLTSLYEVTPKRGINFKRRPLGAVTEDGNHIHISRNPKLAVDDPTRIMTVNRVFVELKVEVQRGDTYYGTLDADGNFVANAAE